ncbi:MAG: hypothetical protein J6Y53_01200 [Alphaproteobacteria bacterium]|nr:hypothetical protein [Alphaproteobacteria bacterium]
MATNEGNDNSKSYDANGFYLEQTHLFQEKLAQSPEFYDILHDVRTAMKLAVLRDRTRGTHDAPWYAMDILLDVGDTYNTVDGRTLRLVSDEFYKRHTVDKNNIADIMGQENLDTELKFKKNNQHVDYMSLDEFVYDEGGRSGFVYATCFGSGGTMGFVNELCEGVKPKVGDKILMTTNFLEDEEFGKLAKIDIYQYNNGKYKHFYQAYSPERGHDYKDTVDITIAMQKKTQATGIAKDKSNSGY